MRSLIAALSAATAVVAGSIAVGAPAASAAPEPDAARTGAYTQVSPTRTANGIALAAGATRTVPITGGATGIPTTASAVAMNVSVLAPTADGALVVWAATASRPGTANVLFTKGQRASDFAVVTSNSTGQAQVYNKSAGSLQLVVDVVGYYASGPATSAVKSYHPVKATRVVDAHIAANASLNPELGGRSPLPGSGMGAVAVTIGEFGAGTSGYLTAGAFDLPIAPAKVLHWSAGQRAAAFAIVPVDALGTLTLRNFSGTTIETTIDVVGYYLQGAPSDAGMLNNVPDAQVQAPTTLAANSTRVLTLKGRGGIALSGVRAVVLTIAAKSAGTGSLLAYSGGAKPGAASLQFVAGRTTSTTAIVALSSAGTVSIWNHADAATSVAVDVTGWVLDGSITAPATRVGRYVRNLARGQTTVNYNTMKAEGGQDHGSDLVLLDIGAQLNDRSGVELSNTSVQLTYAGLVSALQGYLDGYADNGGVGRIAIGTNNSALDWTHYTAKQRGTDWATLVIGKLTVHPGETILGADDIEPGFGTTKVSDALGWKSAYLAATGSDLIFNGSADDCPVDFGGNANCLHGWTQSQLYGLAGGSRTTALPQIYNSRQAIQWANINRVGGGHLDFEGALTEFTLGDSYPPEQGWAGLYHALQTQDATPSLPRVVDLQSDD